MMAALATGVGAGREGSVLRRWVVIPLVLLLGVALQTSLFARLPLFGALPDLLLLVTIGVALESEPEVGAAVGFAAGLLQDLAGVLPLGISALAYTLVGYTVAALGRLLPKGPLAPIGVVFSGTLVGQAFVLLLAFLLGQGSRALSMQTLVLGAFYTASLAAVFLPALRRLLGERREAA